MLGGKVVAELDNTGYKRDGHVYAGRMEIAQHHIFDPGHGFYTNWLSTSPATGSEYLLGSGRWVSRKEIDPLGADVTNPPDPTIVSEPVFYNQKFSQMPIEYTGGPSEYYQSGMDWYLTVLGNTLSDLAGGGSSGAWQGGSRVENWGQASDLAILKCRSRLHHGRDNELLQ